MESFIAVIVMLLIYAVLFLTVLALPMVLFYRFFVEKPQEIARQVHMKERREYWREQRRLEKIEALLKERQDQEGPGLSGATSRQKENLTDG